MVRTQGTQWVTADGKAVVLQGVNLGNWLMPEKALLRGLLRLGRRGAAVHRQWLRCEPKSGHLRHLRAAGLGLVCLGLQVGQ
jgi:hypothetical protein